MKNNTNTSEINEQDFTQQHNPYAEYDAAFDILPLPSKGMFYPEINGQKVDSVKVYYLTAEDEGIMTSPNLIKSGKLLDVLLEKKVQCDIPVSKLLIGDRLAILIYLRATMEQMYKVELIDPENGEAFTYEVDLSTLKIDELKHLPNQQGLFDFVLPKLKKRVTFRLMTGEDETIIRLRQKTMQEMTKTDESMYTTLKLEQVITSVEGIGDRLLMSHFIKNMPILDSRKLMKYMNDVNPSINLEIEAVSPKGNRFRQILPITAEFFYPTL